MSVLLTSFRKKNVANKKRLIRTRYTYITSPVWEGSGNLLPSNIGVHWSDFGAAVEVKDLVAIGKLEGSTMFLLNNARKRQQKEKEAKRSNSIRKAGVLDKTGIAQLTKKWTLMLDDKEAVISFSRDNLHVWINEVSVEAVVYISDRGYDVDLFFDLNEHKLHIFSDVEGQKITNYLFVDDQMVG